MLAKSVCVSFVLLLFSACTSIPPGIKPVTEFELSRYLGTWYEIARFDHSFERGLNQVTAQYSLQQDGSVKVINRGFSSDSGQWEQAEGKALFVQSPDIGHLKVSFFGPFYNSYVIFALDKSDYQYALVTGPERDYLWLLARQPQLDNTLKNTLLNLAEQAGFDRSKLLWVNQPVK